MSEETIPVEEETSEEQSGPKGDGRTWTEEISLAGDEVVGKVQELVREAAVRKITIQDEKGKTLLTIPLYAGVAGMLVFGPWSALALIAAWFVKLSILIEREVEEEETAAPAKKKAGGKDKKEIDEALKRVYGIGSKYAKRLRKHGVSSVAELAAMDAEEVASVAKVPEEEAAEWIAQAKEMSSSQ